MRNLRSTLAGVAVLICAALWFGLPFTGCDESPFEPVEPEEPKDYRVWFWDGTDGSKIFSYHPTHRMLDSVEIPWEPSDGLTVSPDGQLLYLSERSLGVVVVIDTDSMHLVDQFEYRAKYPVIISPNGEYIAIPGENLWIVRIADHSLVFLDTVRATDGQFALDSKSFHYITGWSSGSNGPHVRTVIISDTGNTMSEKFFNFSEFGGPIRVATVHDDSKWILYFAKGTIGYFAFYDVYLDSLVFVQSLMPGHGEFEHIVGDRFVYYTNPGTWNSMALPDTFVTTYDLVANELLDVIECPRYLETYPFIPGDMAITPDKHWMVILHASPGSQFYLYDLQEGKLVDYRLFGGPFGDPKWITGLTVQQNL